MSGPIQRRAMAALGGRGGLLLFGIGLIWLLSFGRHGINWIDEGFALNGAQRIADGDTLYRDFFAPYGPGRYQLLGVAFRGQSHQDIRRELLIFVTPRILQGAPSISDL